MNKKFFLMGLGFGLIICALVMFVAIGTGTFKTSDKNDDSTSITSKVENKKEATTKATTEEETTEEVTTEEKTTEEVTSEEVTTDEEDASDDATTEEVKDDEKSEEETTEEKKDTSNLKRGAVKNPDGKGGSIVVTADMSAEDICDDLVEIGVVSDKWAFYSWFLQSGFYDEIEPGKYNFGGYEQYPGITWILTGHVD